MVTIRDVGKRAGVAPMTVSRVINRPNTVAPETRQRVQEAIADLRYVPNRVGQGLRNRQTMVIALVVSDISNPFAIKQILSVTDAARKANYNVVFVHTQGSVQEELAQLRSLAERRVDGVVLSPIRNTPDAVRFAEENDLTVVVMGYPMPDNDVDVVRCESVQSARELTEYLIGLGHRRVAMLSGPADIVTALERADGYRLAMEAIGEEAVVIHGDFSQSSGYEMGRAILEQPPRPTALVTANNLIAVGVARAAADLGVRMPEDLSVVTFDAISDEIAFNPFFTGIIQPIHDIAEAATSMLLERITGAYRGPGREVILPVTFEINSSTAPPAG